MSELGELLELLHRAGRGFGSVFAEYRIWSHHARSAEAFRAATEDRAGTAAGAAATEGSQPATSERLVRLWMEGWERAREEQVREEGVWYSVVVGESWWTYSPRGGALTNDPGGPVSRPAGNEVMPLLNPTPLIPAIELEPLGRGERAGRPVIVARAWPRRLDNTPHLHMAWMALDTLGRGAEELLLEVDAEHGALLRSEARREGEPFEIKEALAIEFDRPIAPERFVFEPPAGVPVEPIGSLRARHDITIGEAIDAVPFTVHVIERIPEDWSLRIILQEGRERMGIPTHVGLMYRSEDGTAELGVSETAAANGPDRFVSPQAPPWEEIEHAATPMRVARRTEQWPQTQVALSREDTAIVLSSRTLTAEALLDAAASLVPARRPG